MKKLMILGGSRYAIPVIKAAHELGAYVITCDYLPDNIAHKFSDEYCNVSIIEKDAVLDEAERLGIDGIMSFGCDPGVVTAAYVAEKLGLPSVGSYEAVSILQNKGKFRRFLADNGFNVPTAKQYKSKEEALSETGLFNWPVIVKPTDSAGSKGVTKVERIDDLPNAIDYALNNSIGKEFIIEDFLEKIGCSSDTDSFSVDGELIFVSFSAQRFDVDANNPYAPAAYSWPSTLSNKHEEELKKELQRLISLLNLKSSIYNIETRECTDGKAYIMECTPRGGGNRLAEMIRYSTGIDLIKASVLAALGEKITGVEQKPYNGFWAEVILHSDIDGIFDHLFIADDIKANVVEEDLWVSKGDHVNRFAAANEAIGTLVLRFDEEQKMLDVIDNIKNHIRVITKSEQATVKNKFLILGGKPIGSINVVEKAKRMGLYTIVTDYLDPKRSPAKLIADESWDISTADLDRLEQMCKEHDVKGIFTGVNEFNLIKMISLCERLGLPCYCSTQQWNTLENKENFKHLCNEFDLPTTKCYDMQSIRSGDISEIEFPVITKPVDGSGSRGFSVCHKEDELVAAIDKACTYSESGKVLIEKYMDYKTSVIINYTIINKEVFFSGISDKYSAKITDDGGPIMSFQYYPSEYEKTYLETLDEKARTMIASLGFESGVVWIEAFNDHGTFTFNELGLRFGGSLTYLPVQHFYGFNQLDVLMEYAVNGSNSHYIPKREDKDEVYCIFPVHVKPGVITKIVGLDKIKTRRELIEIVPVHYLGDTIEMWSSAQQVYAYIHFVCSDRQKAKEFAEWILDTLQIIDENGDQMLFNLYI